MTKKNRDQDVEFIQSLAELLNQNELTELEVSREYGETDKINVRVSKVGPTPVTYAAAQQMGINPSPTVSYPQQEGSADQNTNDPVSHPGAVTSPMVGTVYMQAEPGTTPFISVGSTVSEGETLLIVEAMKTMNQIPSPKSGIVKRIFVEDGAAVEFGSPLVVVE
jgi:acetyl-CoA carboxylase biotin carboxyl carrier protein